jgi:hypothetical protein
MFRSPAFVVHAMIHVIEKNMDWRHWTIAVTGMNAVPGCEMIDAVYGIGYRFEIRLEEGRKR